MGGARCIFRECCVSSHRYPGMHFFKLPVRQPELMRRWLKYCGAEREAEILKLSPKKQLNRAVCARHFRYECFMNYKLDRLIPNQTPTLMRISKDLAWDLENLDENGAATMFKIPTPVWPHLIPPSNFECPLGLDDGVALPILLTKDRSRPGRLSTKADMTRKRTYTKSVSSEMNKKPKAILVNDEADEKHDGEATFICIDMLNDLDDAPVSSPAQPQLQQSNLDELQTKHDNLKDRFEKLLADHALLAQTKAELEARLSALAQERASITSGSTVCQSPLTKPQLFNGVRKYLGPTMTALVRMEMFGSAERAWKSDEREFATELLQIGESVYKHCSDEWRFRLPALREVRSWLDKKVAADTEEENL